MSSNPNYRSIIAHGGFKAACAFARRAVHTTSPLQLAALQIRRRTQNAGYQKFAKLMDDSKAMARGRKQRAEIDIYTHSSATVAEGSLDEAEEAAAAAELQRVLQVRLDAENQTQVEMLLAERVRRRESKKRKERLQFEVEFKKFDEDDSGGIDPMELPVILDKLIQLGAGGVPHEVVNDVILTCDADGDGTLDFEEFCEILWTLKRDYTPAEPELSDAELIVVLKEEALQKARDAEARFHAAARAASASRLPVWHRDPPHPRRLDLAGEPQTLRQFMLVAEALAKDVHVEEVRLAGCELGPRSGQALATTLLQNQKVARLDLADNHVGPAGAVALFRSVADHGALVRLHLPRNGLGSDGGLALGRALAKNTALRVLDVSWNAFGPSGAAAVLDALAHNTTLRILQFDGNDVTPAGAAALGNGLGRNRGLEELSMSWNELGPAGAAALGRALGTNADLRLRVLRAAGNVLGDAGFLAVSEGVAGCASLEELVLDDCGAGGAGLTALARALVRNRTLRQLSAAWNRCDDAAAAALATALAVNRGLHHLDLSNAQLGPGAFRSLGEALRRNRGAFTSLVVHGNLAGPDGARALAEAAAGPPPPGKIGSPASNATGPTHSSGVDGGWADGGGGGGGGGNNDDDSGESRPALERLVVSGNCLGPHGAVALGRLVARCRHLRVLHVGFNKQGLDPVGPRGATALFRALSSAPVAPVLTTPSTTGGPAAGVITAGAGGSAAADRRAAAPSTMAEVRLRELAEKLDGDDAANSDGSAVPAGGAARRGGGQGKPGGGGDDDDNDDDDVPGEYVPLAEVDTSATDVPAAATSGSGGGGGGSDSGGGGGGGCGGGSGATVPRGRAPLDRLDMEGCLIGADAGIDLCRRLISGDFLVTQLNLSCCLLRLRGGHAASLALRHDVARLVDLNLGANHLGPQNGVWLGEGLACNRTLQRLSLCSNRLRCDGLVGLGRGLATNATLDWLDVSDNGIKMRGVSEFSRLLAPNKTIRHVGLDDNPATVFADRLAADSVVIVRRLCNCNRARLAEQGAEGGSSSNISSTGTGNNVDSSVSADAVQDHPPRVRGGEQLRPQSDSAPALGRTDLSSQDVTSDHNV